MNSIGTGEAEEVMCMILGHELSWGGGWQIAGGKRATGQKWAKDKNWDNCNSIINKIYT